nr:radical SAM protein [Candidatus Levybacteria bacterium]
MGKEAINAFSSLPVINEINSSEDPFTHRDSLYSMENGIYFVPGFKRGTVCDINTGNVYSINESGTEVILGKRDDPQFKTELALELGLDHLEQVTSVDKEKPEINLEFVWFEIISDDCNERCIHCYADSMPPTYRRNLEKRELPVIDNKQKLSAKQWKNLIQESYDLGCGQCQFIGGEPFLWRGENGETVLDLAEHAKSMGFEMVEIFTNATLIKEKDIPRIKELGLNIAVSLYSDREDVHEEITRTPGSFKKTMKTLELLRKAEVSTRVETVLMKQNQCTVQSTDQMIQEMGFSHRSPDVLRPKGRGDNHDLYPDPDISVKHSLMLEPNFSASPEFFKRSVDGHKCLAGKVTITDTGDVLPCIFSRGKVVGNIFKEGSIEKVLEGQIRQIWEITKDDVLVCQDCEYRYVCFDCRPISEGAAQGKGDYETSPYPRCTYNPYEGEWEGGVWKLDEKGKPYYDTSMSDYISQARQIKASSIKPRGDY